MKKSVLKPKPDIPKVLLTAKSAAVSQAVSGKPWEKGPWDKGHWANRK